jgi:hypothetical protein
MDEHPNRQSSIQSMLFMILSLDLRLIREIIIHNNQNSYELVFHSLPPF